MEDVLSVYTRPYEPARPVVCLDELCKTLHETPRGTLPARPGDDAREDYEYRRNGTANLVVSVEPLVGRRRVRVTDRRTAWDFAEELRLVAEEDYPQAARIVLVTDNLNTHGPGCLYERFEPKEAKRLCERFEWHYTPEHASWLNVAEIELSVLVRQCLGRRIPDRAMLEREVAAWEQARNQASVTVDWQFTAEDARIKLKRLYPVIKEQQSS